MSEDQPMQRVDIERAERTTAYRLRTGRRWKWDPPECEQTDEVVARWWETSGVKERVGAQRAKRLGKKRCSR